MHTWVCCLSAGGEVKDVRGSPTDTSILICVHLCMYACMCIYVTHSRVRHTRIPHIFSRVFYICFRVNVLFQSHLTGMEKYDVPITTSISPSNVQGSLSPRIQSCMHK
jgi:hypothetical protein